MSRLFEYFHDISMGIGLDEGEVVVTDSKKKSKHSKKSKTNDMGEDSQRLDEKFEKKKKIKKCAVSDDDTKFDNSLHEEVNGDVQKENDQKKKKKIKFEVGEENKEEKQDIFGDAENEKDKSHKKKKRKLAHNEDENGGENASKEKKEKKLDENDSENPKLITGKNDSGEMREENVRKKKKKEKKTEDNDCENPKSKMGENDSGEKMSEENVGKKKKKKEKKTDDNDSENPKLKTDENDTGEMREENVGKKKKKEKNDSENPNLKTKNPKKVEFSDNVEDENGGKDASKENKKSRKEKKNDESDTQNPKSKSKSPKKVSFSGNVEVFPSEEEEEEEEEKEELVRGKRFTKEEDEKVKEAVYNYINTHNLGEEGLDKVLNCKTHPEVKNCWKEIGSAIPYRPFKAIYCRAHILFQRGEKRKWTQEEYEFVKKAQEKHGNNWKLIADEMGKHRFHVKDAWRRIKLPNMKKGHWSQDEYQILFDLVNTDLQMKASEEKKSKHGMLRDNICWGAISDKLSTRTNQNCCIKWYTQLSSPMVQDGVWADVDDYRLLDGLYGLDACCVEDVDWDELVEGRSGEVCRKRWDQMVLHIGQHGLKSFGQQVDILAKRYCPNLVEVREEWDNKPVVD